MRIQVTKMMRILADPDPEHCLNQNDGPTSVSRYVPVIFVDSECSACGVVGDRRLLPSYCHMEEQLAHTGSLRHLHPSPVHAYHPLHLGQSLLGEPEPWEP
jgi:hypothetical protein